MDRKYEVMFILRPDTPEEDVDRLLQTMETNIAATGGKVTGFERMGKRRLAYTVKKFQDGIYILSFVEGPGSVLKEAGAPPARAGAGDQVHHRSHRRGREAAGKGQETARSQGQGPGHGQAAGGAAGGRQPAVRAQAQPGGEAALAAQAWSGCRF